MKNIKTKGIIFTVSALCFIFLALIWLSYLRQRSFDKKDAIRFAIEKNSNLAVALEQYTIRTMRNADAVLQIVKLAYSIEGDSLNLHKLLRTNLLDSATIEAIAIIGPDGRLKKASVPFPGDSVSDFSDRSYFVFHSSHTADSLLISNPVVSRSIGKPVIIVSRRLNDERGRFAGVVAVQVEPATFTSFYAQAKLRHDDILSLISPRGITYARRTGDRESSGEDISKSPLFVHVAHNPDSFYFAKDAIKGIPTWFSYRKLADYPIVATVGTSLHDIMLDYESRQPRYVIARLIISTLAIFFSILITLVLLHRRKLAEHIAVEEKRYQQILTEQMIAVQEREREWIGRELHDNVNQVLTTVKLYLETAHSQQDNPLVERSMRLVNSTIGEIRALSHQLSAPTLGTRSLVDSINALVETVKYSKRIEIEFCSKGYKQNLIMSQKLAVYRILQEQLNNILKHADATDVWIQLYQHNGDAILEIRDNGRGFDSKAKWNGMGINNIISRARVFGGTVCIDTAPGKGCLLKVAIPLKKVKEEAPVLADTM